ncbi:hypothetical protein SAMN02983003_2911 [Devosia enhydra]|uniref:DUF2125 domain-containing protein n=1 Tax=Devosia enhydra TaxID=665118 RepID=A0A1K2I036_9HYPH|nr:DUF2125 domain-containing protein [Devosia enhydra]SFZ85742.1 hypothetical protein SAMN02983003_2911 [Devosia enhydra]
MKPFGFLAGVVALVAVVWTAGWLYVALQARGAIDQMALADGETSPRLNCGRLDISGFPFRFDLACVDATLVSGDTTAQMAELRASVLVYRPTHAVLSGRGPIDLEDAFTGSRSQLTFAGLEGSVRLNGWSLARASLVATELSLIDTTFEARTVGTAAEAQAHLIDRPEARDATAGTTTLGAYVQLQGVDAPGVEIAGGEAVLEADLANVPDDVRRFAEPGILPAWQASGGELVLTTLKGTAGERSVEASGTLGLDAEGRIEGQVQLGSRGIAELIEPLLPRELGAMILGTRAEDGSYRQQLNARGGVLFSGFVPLTSLPPVF